LRYAEPGDFVYLDPPYATNQTRVFGEYVPNSFARQDLARLHKALKRLDRRRIDFLISYGDTPEAKDLLCEWNIARISTRRNIAGFAGHRKTAYELVATNSRKVMEDAE
jgi:DNA adenine methylase